MEKKYELMMNEYGFNRVKALKDFTLITGETVKKGDLGGLVDGKHNLSQKGNCWIDFEAMAYQKAKVIDDAVMKDYSVARDNATVSGNAVMKDFSWAKGDSIITENAVLQADQYIKFGTVTTDLLGTKDWIGALYAELGVVPNDNKIVLYKKVWRTDDESVFKSNYDRNFLYKIGKTVVAENVDEDVFNSCTIGLHFTSLENLINYDVDTIIECEVEIPDIVTVQGSEVRARKCKVIRVIRRF